MINCTLTPTEWNTNNCIQRQRIQEELIAFGIDIPKFDVSGTKCNEKDCLHWKKNELTWYEGGGADE